MPNLPDPVQQQEDVSPNISAGEVLQQLERISQSQGFSAAGKLRRLLRFTIEETLAGRGTEIKEYLLGVEVFERPETFDPRLDAIVRVQFGRLRARLRDYYLADGAGDPLQIEYPRGSYLPCFVPRRPAPPPSRRLHWLLVLAGCFLIGLFALAWQWSGPPPPDAPPSIAVLPFENLNRDDGGEYFSDGLTEQVIHSLSRISGLRVVARASSFRYRDRHESIRRMGADLRVSRVLEGSVRRENRRVRVAVQLVDTVTGYRTWSATFERDQRGVFALQDEIASSIAAALRTRFEAASAPLPAGRRTTDPEAYRLCLQGRYFWHRRTQDCLRRAAAAFREALAHDPACAAAHAGLADSYALLAAYQLEPAGAKAIAAARRAVELDPGLAEGHAALGYSLATFDSNWQEAETAFLRAIRIQPGYATAHQWYAITLLAPFGRLDEALREMEIAASLDPISVAARHDLGRVHLYRREYSLAAEQFRRAIEIEPEYARSHADLGFVCERLGRLAEAEQQFLTALKTSGAQPEYQAELARFYASTGQLKEARRRLAGIQPDANPYYLAAAEAALGNRDAAFSYLRKAAESRRSPALLVGRFSPLRADSRYPELLKTLGLPDLP